LTPIRPPARRKLTGRPKLIIITTPTSTATYIRTPAMAGKSTTRVRRRPALAHWVAPHSNHAPPAVGRTRGEIHRAPIRNSRPAARGKTGSIALARAKPVGLAAHRKVASEAEAVVSLAVEAAAGLIASVPVQVAPGASVAVGSDGG